MGNFILFILILFALAALLRIDFFFTILYLFAGIYVLSRFWSRRVFRHLNITRVMPERAFLGETINITLELKNRSQLPIPWLLLNESYSSILSSPPFYRKVITMGGKTTHTTRYVLNARRRGYYEIGPLSLETGDFLAINQRVASQYEPNHLIVYPKILPVSELGLPTHSPQPILQTPIPLFQDTTRIIGIREYTPGDNPRHIHWPATAATGQMSVKQFQTAISRDNNIFLNMNRQDYGRPGQADVGIELAIVTAASLANHMIINEELPAGLTITAADPLTDNKQKRFYLPPDKGRKHLMQILEILARVEGSDDIDFAKRLRHESIHLTWGSTVVIITSITSEDLLQTIFMLKRSGFRLTLILVQPTSYVYPRTDNYVQALGVPFFKVTREKDVELWQPIK